MNRKTRTAGASLGALLATLICLALAGPLLAAEGAGGFDGVVNLNSASASELQLLPGVGEARAAAILAIRQQRGGFKSVSELSDVKGIGEALLQKLRPHVSLSGKTTAVRP